MLGIHRYINTLSPFLLVCMYANGPGSFVLWFDALPVTHSHQLLDRSIVFVSLSRHVDDCERKRAKRKKPANKEEKKRERFKFSINTEHCCCFFSIRSPFFFFRFVHLDNALVFFFFFFFFFPSFFLPSVLVLTFPYHRHRSIIFYSVYLSTVKSDSFIILMLNHYILYQYQNH